MIEALTYWVIFSPIIFVIVFFSVMQIFHLRKKSEASIATPEKKADDPSWDAFMADIYSTMTLGEILEKWRDRLPTRKPKAEPLKEYIWIMPAPYCPPYTGTGVGPGVVVPTTTGGNGWIDWGSGTGWIENTYSISSYISTGSGGTGNA